MPCALIQSDGRLIPSADNNAVVGERPWNSWPLYCIPPGDTAQGVGLATPLAALVKASTIDAGIAAFAKGGARIMLSAGEKPGSSVLRRQGDVVIGGKITQLGSRLVAGVVQKLSDQFFRNRAQRFPTAANEASACSRGRQT